MTQRGFRKYAKVEGLQVVGRSSTQVKTASLDKLSDFEDFRTSDGYLYARIWAISSRVNKNHDGWPSVELAGSQEIFDRHVSADGGSFVVEASQGGETGFATFMGDPIFVDHTNSDHKRTRGVIVDSRLHVLDGKTAAEHDPYYATAPANHQPPTRVELLLEIDAKSFPKFAEAVIKGAEDPDEGIDGWSMGCDVDYTVCSICSHKAHSPDEYCSHIQQKGRKFPVKNSRTGAFEQRLAYEDCYGAKFFEISGVFDPADDTALTQEAIREAARKVARNWHATKKTADNPLPQSELTKAPEEVDTLREEQVCPVCGEIMEGPVCDACDYEEPPESFQNPDLHQQDPLHPDLPGQDPLEGAVPEAGPTKEPLAPEVTSRMSWKAMPNPRLAAPGKKDKTDEPPEQVEKDEDEPTTSKSAAEPGDPSFKADKRVNVEGTGGVIDATNEEASRAQKQVDVEGKGGTGVEDVSADRTESVGKEQRIKGTPTDTWSGTEGQADPVSDKAYPSDGGVTGAKKGVQPGDPAFKADDRVNVEEEVSVSLNGGDKTKQWTGTEGNGVTRQQNPVTKEVYPTSDRVSSHFVACFKLADTEVELGFIDRDQKYDRVVELQSEDERFVEAQLKAYGNIKTAGFTRQTSRVPEARRLPTLGRRTASAPSKQSTEVDELVAASAIFADNIPPLAEAS